MTIEEAKKALADVTVRQTELEGKKTSLEAVISNLTTKLTEAGGAEAEAREYLLVAMEQGEASPILPKTLATRWEEAKTTREMLVMAKGRLAETTAGIKKAQQDWVAAEQAIHDAALQILGEEQKAHWSKAQKLFEDFMDEVRAVKARADIGLMPVTWNNLSEQLNHLTQAAYHSLNVSGAAKMTDANTVARERLAALKL